MFSRPLVDVVVSLGTFEHLRKLIPWFISCSSKVNSFNFCVTQRESSLPRNKVTDLTNSLYCNCWVHIVMTGVMSSLNAMCEQLTNDQYC